MDKVYHPAVLVSALADYLLGWLWYGVLFVGVRSAQSHDPVPSIVAAATSIALGYVVAIVLNMGGPQSLARGVQVGVLLGLGLSATTMLENALFEGRPVTDWLVNAGYIVVGLIVIGAIVGGWKPSRV